jgi:hypothetical protein
VLPLISIERNTMNNGSNSLDHLHSEIERIVGASHEEAQNIVAITILSFEDEYFTGDVLLKECIKFAKRFGFDIKE